VARRSTGFVASLYWQSAFSDEIVANVKMMTVKLAAIFL
jgi:hypothetical protein